MSHAAPNGISIDHYPQLRRSANFEVLLEIRTRHRPTTPIPGISDLYPKMHEIDTITKLCQYINRHSELRQLYGYTTTATDIGTIATDGDSSEPPQWGNVWQPLRGTHTRANLWEIMYDIHNFAPNTEADTPVVTWIILPQQLTLQPGIEEPHGWRDYLFQDANGHEEAVLRRLDNIMVRDFQTESAAEDTEQ